MASHKLLNSISVKYQVSNQLEMLAIDWTLHVKDPLWNDVQKQFNSQIFNQIIEQIAMSWRENV